MSNAIIERGSVPLGNYQDLWPRFQSVWSAIRKALTDPSLDIYRSARTIDWGGVDLGIHDQIGDIKGRVGNIDLDIHLDGSKVDFQPKVVPTVNGQMTVINQRETKVVIAGKFKFLKSGLDGVLQVRMKNGEIDNGAFWLTAPGNIYELTQVILRDGVVLDANSLEDHPYQPNIVCVPGTETKYPIQFDKTIKKSD